MNLLQKLKAMNPFRTRRGFICIDDWDGTPNGFDVQEFMRNRNAEQTETHEQ